MIKLVFAVLLIVVAIVVYAKRSILVQPERPRPGDPLPPTHTRNIRWMAIPILILALLLGFFSTYRSVGAREVGIPVTFGSVGADLQPGIHFTSPFTRVVKCTLAEQQTIQNQDPNSGDASYNQSIPISGSDQGGATADVTVAYHVNAEDAGILFRRYACNMTTFKDVFVAQRVRSDVGRASITFVSVSLKAQRGPIEQNALALLRTDLSPFGVTVDSVVIGDITLNGNVQEAANQKLAAQQNAITRTYVQQGAKTDAQTAIITAQGEQAANTAKQQSLTDPILCQQAIQAIAAAKPSVISAWPAVCGGSAPATAAATSVILNAR